MKALYATLRPVWRASTLALLAVVWFVVAFVLQVVPDVSEAMPVLRALWQGTATPAMVAALWVVLVIGPAGIGLILAGNRMALQHTTLSWLLPAVRNRLLVGTVVCGLLVAALPAVLMARNAVTAGATVAAFSLAFCAFLAPGFVFDVAVPRPMRVLVALPLLAVIAWPGSTGRLAAEHPLLVTALGLGLAALQLAAISSGRTARARPFRWSAFGRSGPRDVYWRNRKTRGIEWRRSLATSRLLPWLHAATYEHYQSASRHLLWHLWSTAVGVLIARLVDIPVVIPALAGSFLMVNGLQLRMRVPYPLSRVRRAQLAYAGSVFDAVHYFVILGLLLYATTLVPLPRLPTVDWDPSRPMLWVLAWGCSLALAPIAQWRLIRRPDEGVDFLSGTRLLGFVVPGLIYVFLVVLAAGQINAATRADSGPGRALIAIGIILLVAQATHAALVYAYFIRSDLVRAHDTG